MRFDAGSQVDSARTYLYHWTKYLMEKSDHAIAHEHPRGLLSHIHLKSKANALKQSQTKTH